MENAVLNKTSGTSGVTNVTITPNGYNGKNDVQETVTFTTTKGKTAVLQCIFKGSGKFIYDTPVITNFEYPNDIPAAGGSVLPIIEGYQIYRETVGGAEAGRLTFDYTSIRALGNVTFNGATDPSTGRVSGDNLGTTLASRKVKATVYASINLNEVSATSDSVQVYQEANEIKSKTLIKFIETGDKSTAINKTVGPEAGSYEIDTGIQYAQTYTSGASNEITVDGTTTVHRPGSFINLSQNTVSWQENMSTDTREGMQVKLADSISQLIITFAIAGKEPYMTVKPTELVFKNSSVEAKTIEANSFDTWQIVQKPTETANLYIKNNTDVDLSNLDIYLHYFIAGFKDSDINRENPILTHSIKKVECVGAIAPTMNKEQYVKIPGATNLLLDPFGSDYAYQQYFVGLNLLILGMNDKISALNQDIEDANAALEEGEEPQPLLPTTLYYHSAGFLTADWEGNNDGAVNSNVYATVDGGTLDPDYMPSEDKILKFIAHYPEIICAEENIKLYSKDQATSDIYIEIVSTKPE